MKVRLSQTSATLAVRDMHKAHAVLSNILDSQHVRLLQMDLGSSTNIHHAVKRFSRHARGRLDAGLEWRDYGDAGGESDGWTGLRCSSG